MAITIDDFCVATNSTPLYNKLLHHLGMKYKVKNVGKSRHIIGWSLTRNQTTGGLHINQPHLTQTYIEILKMEEATTARTPYPSGIKTHATTEEEETLDNKRYPFAKAVGTLRYLVDSTRPDLAYVVGLLARHKKKHVEDTGSCSNR